MYGVLSYFYRGENPVLTFERVKFGRHDPQVLDYQYNDIATRLELFARESGVDPYNRYFDMEPLVDFAIEKDVTDKSADYIYRHYIYNILTERGEDVDIESEEARILYEEFLLVPEGTPLYYGRVG